MSLTRNKPDIADMLVCIMCLLCSLKNKLGQAITVLRMYHHKVGTVHVQQHQRSCLLLTRLALTLAGNLKPLTP